MGPSSYYSRNLASASLGHPDRAFITLLSVPQVPDSDPASSPSVFHDLLGDIRAGGYVLLQGPQEIAEPANQPAPKPGGR